MIVTEHRYFEETIAASLVQSSMGMTRSKSGLMLCSKLAFRSLSFYD